MFIDVQAPLYFQRKPSEEHTKLGVLTSITKPTGEMEKFEYELNDYSRAGRIRSTGYYYDYALAPQKVGGLRISKITLGNQVKKYKYVESFDPNNPDYIPDKMSPIGFSSSGTLHRMPTLSYLNKNLVNALSIFGESHITYSKVIEYNEDKSYTVYTFNSALEFPDVDNTQNPNFYKVLVTPNIVPPGSETDKNL